MPATPAVRKEFSQKYEAELRRWLRRRVLWYAGAMAVVWGLLGAFRTYKLAQGVSLADTAVLASLASAIVKPLACLGVLLFVLRRAPETLSRARLILIVTVLVVAMGAISELMAPLIVSRLVNQNITISGTDPETAARMAAKISAAAPFFMSLFLIFFTHLSASLFIPWSLREALRPLWWLWGISVLSLVFQSSAPLEVRLIFVAILPLAGAPGVLISWWRYARFGRRFGQAMLAERYGELERELVDARRIHEALFPPPISRGPVRLSYRYEPMRQIGGDFLYAYPTLPAPAPNEGALSVVVIDVTGHGVPAAMTVSGLHGELERVFANNPRSSPGEALLALNQHASGVLARHRVFPSALCLRVDPERGTLTWASAGHPPAFVRRTGGEIEALDSTAFLLGVCGGPAFEPGEQSVAFGPGDAVLVYTDGASEALNVRGAMLRPQGVREAVAGAKGEEGSLASAVSEAVERHRHGPADDDALIVEVWRVA